MTHQKAKAKPDIPFKELESAYMFRDLSPAQIEKFKNLMTERRFEEQEYILKEGTVGTEIYILMEGKVEISKALVLPQVNEILPQQEKALIRLSHENHPFFGEMSMFEVDGPREASIRAITPCRMIQMDKGQLKKFLEKEKEIGMIVYRNMASELVQRLRKANRDILKLTTALSLALES